MSTKRKAVTSKGNLGDGMLKGAEPRDQSVTAEWDILHDLIDGVRIKDVRHIPKQGGFLTELFRRDWELDASIVDQIFQVVLNPGVVSAWHMHRNTIDRLMVSHGMMKVVLYDARKKSPTYRRINEFRFGTVRPGIISLPPGVWHGVQNISDQPSTLINIVDLAYNYQAPDHWALPAHTDQIPYTFSSPITDDLL